MTATLEYEFEQLSPRIGGARCGYFDGAAILGPDRGGFVVEAICLDGPEIKWLFRYSSDPLESLLRNAIEAALYADPHVRDAWAAHVEEERDDAA